MTSVENEHPGSPTPYSPLHSASGSKPGPQNRPLAPLDVDKRGGHPRGCRFRDLGEAHRNITGRSISAAYSATAGPGGLTGSISSSTDNSDMVSPRRNVTSPMTFGVPILYEASSPPSFGRRDRSPAVCTTPKHEETKDAVSPEDMIDEIFGFRSSSRASLSPAFVTSPFPTHSRHGSPALQLPNLPKMPHLSEERSFHDDNEDFSPLSLHTVPHYNRSSGSQMAMTVDSRDTTVRMYKQYQEFILNQPSPTPVPVQKTVYRRDGAEGRLATRQDGSPGGAINGSPVSDPTPHSSLLPSLGEGAGKTENASNGPKGSGGARTQSMIMSMPTRESLLYPKPLRVQSIRAEGKHTSLYSGIAVSGTGMTTDSEEDPFRYDKDAYKIFLHPSKERDVSTALNHISGINSHSQATLHGFENDLAVRQMSLRPPPIPKQYIKDDPFSSGPTRARSATPESADGFYDTSVIQPNWAVERSEYEVKVVLQDVSRNNSMNASSRPSAEVGRNNASNKYQRTSFFKPPQIASLSRRKGKENTMPSSELGDWETIATSVPGLGSIQLPLPPVHNGYGQGRNSRGNKMTGSSVADVSDDGSFSQMQFNEYASTDRIVQHPSGHEDSEESLQIRNMSGTKIPIMIPKQRVHRVNGFAQNTSRMLPQSQFSGGEAAAAFARKVSSPFRQLSGRRARPFSPTPLHPLPYKLGKGKPKFEFQQSFQASDRDTFGLKQVYEFQGMSSETGNTQSDTFNMTLSEDTSNQAGNRYSLRDSGSSASSHRTIHSFPFPLIPLPEAARKEAVRRQTAHMGVENLEMRPYWDRNDLTKGRMRISDRREHRSYQRSTTEFFSSLFAPSASTTQSSCYRTQRHSRLKKSRAIANDLTVPSTINTMTSIGDGMPQQGSTWASFVPFRLGSDSSGPSYFLRSAATKLHLDELGRKLHFQTRRPDFAFGTSSTLSRSNTPRLYPWDYPMRRQRERQERRTDPELRAIALPECHGIRGPHGRNKHTHDLERTGVPLDPEAFLSWNARHRRRVWFYCVLVASMFPFISVLVYMGTFNSALSWFTRGEVSRLNNQQRRVIFLVMILQFVLWPIVLGVVIWRTMV
ncbi:hypothetical protein F503_06713 [Ophiostoma piceae UAMH 11346]|uniref:Uncharacterized protein n=1 Tax=Ophiostoma piceae (strain UAMH 11346) TaxID=1262450 RepID=S3CS96_OPHP1|nr:hypothetical protein F503_06713 [Ophiostoma piceae UAMH 11346]